MAKSKTRQALGKGRPQVREAACVMQVVNVASGCAVRHILRCVTHGQIHHQDLTIPGLNMPTSTGTYPGGRAGRFLMDRDFQAHVQGVSR